MFVYTDQLPDICEITGSTSMCSSTIIVQHLLSAADRYNLDRLKLLCESKLSEEINAATVATTLALAEQHQCQQLKDTCLKFAANPANLGGAYSYNYSPTSRRAFSHYYYYYCYILSNDRKLD